MPSPMPSSHTRHEETRASLLPCLSATASTPWGLTCHTAGIINESLIPASGYTEKLLRAHCLTDTAEVTHVCKGKPKSKKRWEEKTDNGQGKCFHGESGRWPLLLNTRDKTWRKSRDPASSPLGSGDIGKGSSEFPTGLYS